MPNKEVRILMLGDVYSSSGLRALSFKLKQLKKELKADFAVVNAENAYNGFGLSIENMNQVFDSGADVITSGNHIWQQYELRSFLDTVPCLLRPANYGASLPGHGFCEKDGICVINLQGRVGMNSPEDPFKVASEIIRKVSSKVILVDFHAEDSAEKEAMGIFLNGKATVVAGTHTHVQTADERILDNGTAYITDIGFCGPVDSVIGCDVDTALRRQKTQMPIKAVPSENMSLLKGVVVTADSFTGKAVSIERVVY